MGFDLYNDEPRYFRFNIWGWDQVLRLGRAFGWRPRGTVIEPVDEIEAFMYELWQVPPPEDAEAAQAEAAENAVARLKMAENWSGTYYRNEGETVLAEDAQALADALASALDHIPDERIPIEGEERRTEEDGTVIVTKPAGEDLFTVLSKVEKFFNAEEPLPQKETCIQYFSGDKDLLRNFITFCRAGRFKIY